MKKILGILLMLLVIGCVKQTTDDFETVDVVGDFVELEEETDEFDQDIEDLEATEDVAEEIENMDKIEETIKEEIIVEEPIEVKKETTSSDKITVFEGELVKLNVAAKDPDGDTLTYKFSKPLNTKGEWQTNYGDAGTYTITVTVTDGKNEVSTEITVVVKKKNRSPTITKMEPITINEGETIRLAPEVIDPDGDKITLKFSGWMTSAVYTTTNSDEGEYVVTITATDEKGALDSESVTIKVVDVNQAPFDLTVTQG